MPELSDLPQRFRDKVRVEANGCWTWLAGKGHKGHARFWAEGLNWVAHDYAYEKLIGPVPEGHILDHFRDDCDKYANPWHCEPVTNSENMRRHHAKRTHCKRGHPFDEVNTITLKLGRGCRLCQQNRVRHKGGGCASGLEELIEQAVRSVQS